MLFPIIRVKDKGKEGRGRILGTNSHDVLIVNEQGSIDYLDLQCMGRTGEHGSCEFVAESIEDFPYPVVEFVTFEQLIEIYKNEIKELCEAEKLLIDLANQWREEQIEKNGLNKECGLDNTAGILY